MRQPALKIANGFIGLAILAMLTAALIVGQARATHENPAVAGASDNGKVINVNLTLHIDELPVDVKKALSN